MKCPRCGSWNVKSRNESYRVEGRSRRSSGTKECRECGGEWKFWESVPAVARMLWLVGVARGAGSAKCAGE